MPATRGRAALAAAATIAMLLTGCTTPDRGGTAGTRVEEQPAVVAGNLWSKRLDEKKRALEAAARGSAIEVSRTPDNQLKLTLPGDLAFDPKPEARAELRPAARPALDQFAAGVDTAMRVRVVAHTDNVGAGAANQATSQTRAQAVRDYLIARAVPAARIEAIGRGEREPTADNSSETGRARNRRIELYLREPEPKS